MRVLFLTNIPSPYRVDFFYELGKYCDLTVIFERKHALDRNNEWTSNNNTTYKSVFLNGKNIKNDKAICPEIVKWINKDMFDIFVVGGYSTPTAMIAIQIMKMKKIPFILNSDGGIIKKDKIIKKIVKKYFISSASICLSTGEMTNKYLLHYGVKKENIFIYPFTSIIDSDIVNSILPLENKSILRKKLGIKGNKIVISVGQFIHRKGYDILINSWKNIDKDYTLVIIGGGEKEFELKGLISKNKLQNIKIVDFKSKKELKEYYLAADLFVLPTREDIWGLVINEAMAHGLPIITTDKCIAGLELIQENENGCIIPVEQSELLSMKIKSYIEDTKLIDRTSKNNLKKIKEYTIEKMVKKHIQIFEIYLNKNSW